MWSSAVFLYSLGPGNKRIKDRHTDTHRKAGIGWSELSHGEAKVLLCYIQLSRDAGLVQAVEPGSVLFHTAVQGGRVSYPRKDQSL